ncbi:MAG: hypothetical protein LBO02_00095 [Holosporaceae bacterium]|jgi:hypothetical protein|nr:hypothetical protein [Holosporaceae bacterium]
MEKIEQEMEKIEQEEVYRLSEELRIIYNWHGPSSRPYADKKKELGYYLRYLKEKGITFDTIMQYIKV